MTKSGNPTAALIFNDEVISGNEGASRYEASNRFEISESFFYFI